MKIVSSRIRKWCSLLCMVLMLVSCTSDIEPYGATLKESSGGSGGQDKTPSLRVSPTTVTLSDQGEATAYVTASADLSWTLADVPSWLSVSPKSGTGNATLTLTASAENPSTEPRSATITVTSSSLNAQFTVTQPGVQLSVGSTSVNFTAAGGTQSLTITSNTSWRITEKPEWISCETNGKGSTSLMLTASPNTLTNDRSAQLIIETVNGAAKVTIEVKQAADDELLEVDEKNVNFTASGDKIDLKVTSNVSWNVSCTAEWIMLNPKSGNGNGTFTITCAANTLYQKRSATLTLRGEKKEILVDISQAGIPTTLSIEKESVMFSTNAPAKDTISVTSNEPWEANVDVSWCTLEQLDSQHLIVSTSVNTSSTRSATVIITGVYSNEKRKLTVTQKGMIDKEEFGDDKEL